MSQQIATKERVFEAAEALQKRGERVSIRTVRKEIGHGSPETIGPLLALWHATKVGKIEAPTDPSPFPEALTRVLSDFGVQFLQFARTESKKDSDAVATEA